MPLRDHFHGSWSEENPWEGFHSAWINTLVRHLNGSLLPQGFRAFPQVHLGPYVESDVVTFEKLTHAENLPSAADEANGKELWSPPAAVQTLEIDWPGQEVFEVRVQETRAGMRLVAVVELVSPSNKDRPEERQAFITKCANYLREQIGVVVVDIVTTRHANLHGGLLEMFSVAITRSTLPHLYCVSYRNRDQGSRANLDIWPYTLTIGGLLPTVPLWLAGTRSVPLDLEKAYQETCDILRIGS